MQYDAPTLFHLFVIINYLLSRFRIVIRYINQLYINKLSIKYPCSMALFLITCIKLITNNITDIMKNFSIIKLEVNMRHHLSTRYVT